jgi:hypothetical protein
MFRQLLRREEGASILEFGIVFPILLLLMAMTFPLLKGGYEYISLSRAVASGVRYASRTDENVRVGPSGTLTRRPTEGEVAAFVTDAIAPLNIDSVTVFPDPTRALPGEPIKVTATYTISYGVMADVANAVHSALGLGGNLAQTTVITVSGRGREE